MKGLSILTRRDIPFKVVAMLLSTAKVNVTATTLEKDLQNHPDYPALLSISDVLEGYGLDNITFVADINNLAEIPKPFIAQVKSEYTLEDLFIVVDSVQDGMVNYYEPEIRRHVRVDNTRFDKMWPSRIALIADASEAHGEKEYVKKRLEERQVNFIKSFSWLSLPLLAILSGFWRFTPDSPTRLFYLLLFLLMLFGSIVGATLLWYELDEYNPLLQKICSAGKKINCGAILNSKAAKIAGMSWSTIGFTYFAGGIFVMLFSGLIIQLAFPILAWFTLLASPYILYSVYYQWRIARQWCILCLTVQGILALQLVTVFAAGWHFQAPMAAMVTPEVLIPVVFSYLLPFIAVSLLLPLYRTAKENRLTKAEYQRMKHNPLLFESMLSKQQSFSETTEGLGITIGSRNPTHKIVKVCNPYCTPCSRSHAALSRLVRDNPDVQLQIIFHTSNNEKDSQRFPVKHFLAMADRKDDGLMEEVLDDWYLDERKNYDRFAEKYPVSEEAKNNEFQLAAMSSWISKADIHATPTVYVNGYKLPPAYSVDDLKYFLSV